MEIKEKDNGFPLSFFLIVFCAVFCERAKRIEIATGLRPRNDADLSIQAVFLLSFRAQAKESHSDCFVAYASRNDGESRAAKIFRNDGAVMMCPDETAFLLTAKGTLSSPPPC